MFSRIKEAKRIITYREPAFDQFDPDIVIEEQKVSTTKSGRAIALVVSLIALAAGILILLDPSWLPRFDESLKKTAAGWVGIVFGYWLS